MPWPRTALQLYRTPDLCIISDDPLVMRASNTEQYY